MTEFYTLVSYSVIRKSGKYGIDEITLLLVMST